MRWTHPEEIKGGTSVESGLFVHSTENGGLLGLFWHERGIDVKLEALDDLVLELELTAEHVCGGPNLCESKAVLDIGILCLQVGVDEVGL